MERAISRDLAVRLTAGHPQDVQLCLTLVRCEIGREIGDDCSLAVGRASGTRALISTWDLGQKRDERCLTV